MIQRILSVRPEQSKLTDYHTILYHKDDNQLRFDEVELFSWFEAFRADLAINDKEVSHVSSLEAR